MEVKDSGGLTNTTTKQITVTSQNTPPVASFTVSPGSGQIGTTFQFDASGCTDSEDPTSALQIRWDWENDGYWDTNYSTTKTKSHQYNSEGTKTIKLEVKDTGNLTATTTRQVTIGNINYDEMVFVAAGSFEMGSNSGGSNEKPVHTVNLDAFYIDKYEVTNGKYATYLNEALAAGLIQASSSTVTKDGNELLDLNDSDCQISYSGGSFVVDSGKENYPVIEVTWYGANEYAKHYGKRLPTEAEWEYSARGGSQSQGYTYSGSNNAGDVAWYSSNSGGSTHTVGTKQENEIGTHDMSGNVWEWCNDWYDSDYYSSSSSTNNPQGPSSGSSRVLRGGSWSSDTYYVRSANRNGYNPYYSYSDIGFRCVR